MQVQLLTFATIYCRDKLRSARVAHNHYYREFDSHPCYHLRSIRNNPWRHEVILRKDSKSARVEHIFVRAAWIDTLDLLYVWLGVSKPVRGNHTKPV